MAIVGILLFSVCPRFLIYHNRGIRMQVWQLTTSAAEVPEQNLNLIFLLSNFTNGFEYTYCACLRSFRLVWTYLRPDLRTFLTLNTG